MITHHVSLTHPQEPSQGPDNRQGQGPIGSVDEEAKVSVAWGMFTLYSSRHRRCYKEDSDDSEQSEDEREPSVESEDESERASEEEAAPR